MTYKQLYDGDAVVLNPQKRLRHIACCDCGLIHTVEYIVGHRQKLTVRAWRSNRRTGQLRRFRKHKKN